MTDGLFTEIGNALVLRVVDIKLDAPQVKASLNREIAEIEGYLNNLRNNTQNYNNQIRNHAERQLQARKTKLLGDQNLVSELGFALRGRTNARLTYAAPEGGFVNSLSSVRLTLRE